MFNKLGTVKVIRKSAAGGGGGGGGSACKGGRNVARARMRHVCAELYGTLRGTWKRKCGMARNGVGSGAAARGVVGAARGGVGSACKDGRDVA